MRESWPVFASCLLLLALLALLVWLPREFVPGLLSLIFLLLLIPAYWGLTVLATFYTSLVRQRRLRARALDPNLSPEELKALAVSCSYMLQNEAMPLLLLENPNLSAELEEIFAARREREREEQRRLRGTMNRALKRLLIWPAMLLLFYLYLWLTRPAAAPPMMRVAPFGFSLYNPGITSGRLAAVHFSPKK